MFPKAMFPLVIATALLGITSPAAAGTVLPGWGTAASAGAVVRRSLPVVPKLCYLLPRNLHRLADSLCRLAERRAEISLFMLNTFLQSV